MLTTRSKKELPPELQEYENMKDFRVYIDFQILVTFFVIFSNDKLIELKTSLINRFSLSSMIFQNSNTVHTYSYSTFLSYVSSFYL